MNSRALIEKMIEGTIKRARREMVACVIILLFFGTKLGTLPRGAARFDGCVLLLLAAVWIAGVVWKFTLSPELLQRHPENDAAFWRRIFREQTLLLRLVPVWYLTPLTIGVLLYAFPPTPSPLAGFYSYAGLVILIFAFLTWINWSAAAQLEKAGRVAAP